MTRLIDCRFVGIEPETALVLEEVGEELMRAGDMKRGLKLLALFLAWQDAPQTRRIEFEPLTENVTHSLRADSEALRLRVIEGGLV